jgi:NAD(P)-dependent dehydrogenase (short-subunit alcohol dehydrogenase family)
VFLTGATSKIGKAIALYLSARGVKVNMLTPSAERFAELLEQAKPEHRGNLVHCTTVAQGSACDQWVVGKPLSPKEQQHAPKGAMFHQVRRTLHPPHRPWMQCVVAWQRGTCLRIPPVGCACF